VAASLNSELVMARLFTGDYSTGNFGQWATILHKNYLGNSGAGYTQHTYPLQLTNLGDCGYAARFEVRDGDTPSGFPTGERSEVGQDNATTVAPIDATRWYAFSIKFDSAFPANHNSDLGWGITNQWSSGTTSAPGIKFGFQDTDPPGGADDYWSLFQQPQSAPGVYLGDVRLLNVPMNRGTWIDVKMEAHWSPVDANGYLRVWINGARQTFLTGGQTFTGRTTIPGDTHVHYREGYYREDSITSTGIIYHAGFRMADNEASL
jgi:hypothetical protein